MSGNLATDLRRHKETWRPHLQQEQKAGLRTFFAALADRANNPVDILFGPADSITEGAGASAKAKRHQDLVRDMLRAKYQPAGVAGGDGYVPAFSYYSNPWTYGGTYTQPSTDGLGFLGITMSAAATATLNFTGTALDVFYAKTTGGGTLTVSVDGASSGTGFATINTANASKVNGAKVRVGGLTAGAHTVVITCSTAASVLEGVMVYNGDETKGIRVWNNAHAGHQASSFSAATSAWTGAVTAIQPSLVVIHLGVNDWRNASSTVAASTFGSSITTCISAVRAACTVAPSILLVAPYRPATGTNTSSCSFQMFQNYVYRIAGAGTEVDLLNLYQRMGADRLQANQLGLLSVDNIHPSDKGHQFIADMVTGRLSA